jgi:hypothetical protein
VSHTGDRKDQEMAEVTKPGDDFVVNHASGRMLTSSATRIQVKIRFRYEDLEPDADGTLDTRGRRGLADVPVVWERME